MRHEITRLETEIAQIDAEIQKINVKMINLINIKKKKEHDASVLKANFSEVYEERAIQTDLRQIAKHL